MGKLRYLLWLVTGFGIAIAIQDLTWRHDCFVCFLLGLPGMLIDFVIEGPHGGSHNEVIIGEFLSTLVNTVFFAWLLSFIFKRIRRRRKLSSPSVR